MVPTLAAAICLGLLTQVVMNTDLIGLLPGGMKTRYQKEIERLIAVELLVIPGFGVPGVLGLGLTALMASFMSGMAGNVTAFNTVWTYDIYRVVIKKDATDRMGKCVAAFKHELKRLRTGRAEHLVDLSASY